MQTPSGIINSNIILPPYYKDNNNIYMTAKYTVFYTTFKAISVIMFIVYYIIDNTGYKMAREALWPSWAGMWLSSFILLPIGIFLSYKAATDSPLFNPEAWSREWQKIKQDIQQRYGRWMLEIKKIRK